MTGGLRFSPTAPGDAVTAIAGDYAGDLSVRRIGGVGRPAPARWRDGSPASLTRDQGRGATPLTARPRPVPPDYRRCQGERAQPPDREPRPDRPPDARPPAQSCTRRSRARKGELALGLLPREFPPEQPAGEPATGTETMGKPRRPAPGRRRRARPRPRGPSRESGQSRRHGVPRAARPKTEVPATTRHKAAASATDFGSGRARPRERRVRPQADATARHRPKIERSRPASQGSARKPRPCISGGMMTIRRARRARSETRGDAKCPARARARPARSSRQRLAARAANWPIDRHTLGSLIRRKSSDPRGMRRGRQAASHACRGSRAGTKTGMAASRECRARHEQRRCEAVQPERSRTRRSPVAWTHRPLVV